MAKTLQKATFPAEQAEALARVLREREEANLSAVATKQDLAAPGPRRLPGRGEGRILMWLIGMLLAQTAMIVALVKLWP